MHHFAPHIPHRLRTVVWPALIMLLLMMMSCAAEQRPVSGHCEGAPCCERVMQVASHTSPTSAEQSRIHNESAAHITAFAVPFVQVPLLANAPKTSPPV